MPGGEGRVGHRRTTQPTEATLSDVWGEGPLPAVATLISVLGRSRGNRGSGFNPSGSLCENNRNAIFFFLFASAKGRDETGNEGRDESKRRRAESQWIVAARPLCHLQYPVAYLSRLQRILPAARWELRFKGARAARPPRGLHLRHVPLGAEGPYCGSAIGRRAHASLLARILT